MTNPPKARGTAAETAVVRYLRARGLEAHRVALAGVQDQGDVHACGRRVVIEVKSRRGLPSLRDLEAWMAETEREAQHAVDAGHPVEVAVLVVKRPGSAKPEQWTAHLPTANAIYILTKGARSVVPTTGTVAMTVGMLADHLAAMWAEQ